MRKIALFDLDGTLWKNGVAISTAVESIKKLKENQVEVYYVTNNSTATIDDFVNRIQAIGVECSAHDILNTGVATGLYCQEHNVKTAYIIGEDGLKTTLADYGVTHTNEQPEAVIVGLKRDVIYEELAIAMRCILAGSQFIATNTDAQFPVGDGLLPGAGSIVSFVKTASKQEPVVIGKPNRPMLDAAFERYQLTSDDIVIMVGDNYDTDIYGGIDYGIKTIHVEGGVHSTEHVMKQDKKPTISVPNLMAEEVFELFT
ncbi:MAG: HAD-IIA family hydrolase [Culicoidibacterales bacterium]